MNNLKSAFKILSKRLHDYEDRPQQFKMAKEVFACLKDKQRLIVEAGTGVGKSFAYLIPVILSGKKTIVSTASIALQEQLAKKDLVFLQNTLPQKFSFAILKGKNNYLCLKREREFVPLLSGEYRSFTKWVQETKTGDKDEIPFIPDFWSRLCGDSDDCNVNQCPFYNDCFYYRHYKSLYKKDILVINHHVLMLDVLSGFNFLPFHNQLIIDEAHQIENVISSVFGNVLTHSRLLWLLYRLKGLKIAVDHIFEPVENFFKIPPYPPFSKGGSVNSQKIDMLSKTVSHVPNAVIEDLKNLKSQLALDKVIHRLEGQRESADDDQIEDRITTTINYINSLEGVIDDFIEQADKDKVYYIAGNKKGIELKSNLVEVQTHFNGLCGGYESVIMTSATLTAGGNFGFIKERLGATDFKEMDVGSPFDYKRQAQLYLDKELPPPNRENNASFQRKSLEVIEGLIAASKGRALVLFTSYNHLRYAAENINITYPSKSQGNMPPSRLIQWFKKTDNAVLLATATFWQGIDIKGEKLSLVIIVKMPFGSPGDPVYDERCRRLGERWFSDLALPSAILMLKQGFGRLIRSTDDYGVIAILDSRLVSSSYGRTIVSSLPEMDIVHDVDDIKIFFDCIPQSAFTEDKQDDIVSFGHCDNTGKSDNISKIVALGESEDPSVIPQLIDYTKSKNGNDRRLAASALGKLSRFKPQICEAVESLESLLKDEKPQVRQYALKAISKIGTIDQNKIKSIMENLYEKEYNVSLVRRLIRRAKK
ncbi:MAG: HEAT repeat domain-containing protein [Nitrospirae bacterium]|nr:HEAT repeat domain-containing protein [Nitrospirota bacterium]